MTSVVESHRHKYIYPETPFLMEMRKLRPIDFVIRMVCLKCAVFPSYLWSNILCIVISLQGGKVVEVGECSWCSFNAEHVSLIQIHDHISYMALQLWVRCLFSLCHILLNVILHARTHTTPTSRMLSMCTLTHVSAHANKPAAARQQQKQPTHRCGLPTCTNTAS